MKPWLSNINRVNVLPRPSGIDLRYSEWTERLDTALFDEFKKTLKWEDFSLYPDTNLLKDKLAHHHGVQSTNIFLAPGSAEAIRSVFDCLNLGESITTTEPCFPMYDVYGMQNNLALFKTHPEKNRYTLNKLEPSDLIIFSRPSSPIGCFFTRLDVIDILKNNKNWVVVDEAYIDYVENKDSILDLISEYNNLIISRSFSKGYGAAGCRVGYLISDSKNIDIISKFRQMYEVSAPAMKYAMFLLDRQDVIDNYAQRTITERKKLIDLFDGKQYRTLSSEGNWLHVKQSDQLIKILSDNNIHVKQNVMLPDMNGPWIRFTVGPGVFKLFKKIL